jgi:hypothetical protein
LSSLGDDKEEPYFADLARGKEMNLQISELDLANTGESIFGSFKPREDYHHLEFLYLPPAAFSEYGGRVPSLTARYAISRLTPRRMKADGIESPACILLKSCQTPSIPIRKRKPLFSFVALILSPPSYAIYVRY